MKPNHDHKCGVCATRHFERNRYFYGKQFTVRDLQQEQSYFIDKRRLVNRMVFGWGVVCGLDVYWDKEKRKLVVKPGMALDCCGHEIVVCDDQYLSFDDNADDCCFEDKQQREGKFVLCLEYYECDTETVDLPASGCDDKGKTETNRIREEFKLTLKPWEKACPREPPKDHICPDRYKHDAIPDKQEEADTYKQVTTNPDEQAAADTYKQKADGSNDIPDCKTEDIHHFLCWKLKSGCPECESCDCVILATIEIAAAPPPEKDPNYQSKQAAYPGQQPPAYQDPVVDPCTNRKLVYNNSLLYDLIYCYHGDLPHIVDFSWRNQTYPDREIGFDEFVEMIRKGLTVYFDQEMDARSLNSHTFIVWYRYQESGTHTRIQKHLPVREIQVGTEGDCHTATFFTREDWIKEELDTLNSELRADTRYESGVSVEITLRGSRIWSTKGKALDGEYLADRLPTGNGTQGGDFVDWFSVIPSEAKAKGKSYEGQF